MENRYLIQYRQQGSAELREQKRTEHIAYRKGLNERLLLAGPLLSEDGDPIGSVIILSAADQSAAHEIATEDPFVKAGLLRIETIQRLHIAMIKALT